MGLLNFFLIISVLGGLLVGLAMIIFFFYASNKYPKAAAKPKTAPKPPGSWPLIGHLPLMLSGTQVPHVALGAIADKYGPLFTLQLGLHPALVVSSWEVAKEIFTTNDLAVSARAETVSSKIFSYGFAMFSFAPYNAYWREIRKIATSELLSNRRLDLLKHIRVSEVKNSIKDLYRSSSSGVCGVPVTVDLKKWFGELNGCLMIRAITGKNARGGEAGILRFLKAIRKSFKYMGMFVVRDAVPALGWLDVGGHEKAMKETANELDRNLQQWLEEHKQKRAASEEEASKDFMDVLISILDGKKGVAGYDADTVTKATSMTLIAGGTDTSTVIMIWAISLLMNNPKAMKRVQEEMDTYVGRERLVNDADIRNLLYLQAVVKETLRLYPPGPLSGFRQFTEDCNIAGYHVRKGTWLIVNCWKIQTDPRVWSEPFEFKPERFLTTHKDVDVRGQNFELIPFGSGRRVCPGITFGLQNVHLALATLIQGFDMSTPDGGSIDMTESAGLTNLKPTPLDLHLSPRLSPHLYA